MTSDAVGPDRRPGPSADADVRELDVAPLLTNNDTVLPAVYDVLYRTGTPTAVAIASRIGSSRQVVHANLDRLETAGLAATLDDSTYRLVTPAPDPAVVQSLAGLGSRLRKELCAFAVDEGVVHVGDVRAAFDRSASNARKVLNDLADDGYLYKQSGGGGEGLLTYSATETGRRELRRLEDPTAYRDRSGESVAHHADGIEGTAFRTAYEVEDVHVVAEAGSATVDELLAATEKSETATRRRLDRLVDRGLLEVRRREARNVYRPAPRTRAMIGTLRDLADERRRRAWRETVPDGVREALPEPFYPEDLYELLATELHEASPSLADEYVAGWKDADLVEGNRIQGFRFAGDR